MDSQDPKFSRRERYGVVLETRRLTLRPFREDDVEPLFAIHQDRDAMRYTYAATSREDCAHRLRTFAALASTLGVAPWTVVLRNEERVIGWGGLSVDPFQAGWGFEVSYYFDRTCWGRGYATELVLATLQYGFCALSLSAIAAFARPENASSARVLAKCGFTLLCYEPLLERNHYEARRATWERGATTAYSERPP